MANQNQNRNQTTAVAAANRPSAVTSVAVTTAAAPRLRECCGKPIDQHHATGCPVWAEEMGGLAPGTKPLAPIGGADAIRSRMVEIPMKPAEGYAGRSMHFDLSGKQAETLKQITAALLAQEAKLVDGRRVSNGRMTIEWILEQVARS